MRGVDRRRCRERVIARLTVWAGHNLCGSQPIEVIPIDHCRNAGGVIPNTEGGALLIVDRVSADRQTRTRIWGGYFLGIGDDRRVLRIGPLLDKIVLDGASAAVRQIDAVAGGAVRIDKPVVRQDVDSGAAFQLMTDARVMKI